MKKIFIILPTLLLFLSVGMKAARVDSLSVHSPAMKRDVKVTVICPDKVVQGEKCPTLYLLHGYGGNEKTWLTQIKTDLPEIADRNGIIIVCPDGENSWYWDSPVNKDYRYETFMYQDLVQYIDMNYATKADRNHRAITGLSMGGHGGLWLSIRHQDVFGGGGSMSGGLDIRPFPDNWHMKDQLGEEATNQEIWDNHTVINQLDKLNDGALAIIIDCGYDDFFLEVNKAVHEKLLEKGIGHDFIVRPGVHKNNYWNNAIDYQILFFKKFFDKSK